MLSLALAASSRAELPIARITQVLPPGGRAGTSFEVTVTGADLDEAAPLHFSNRGISATPTGSGNKFNVTIASNTPPGVYEMRFLGRFGLSNPRAFVVGSLPETKAEPTNATPARATRIALDTTINGLAQANTLAWYQFTAKKGQRLFVECLTEAIDSRMEPNLVVADQAGHELERARQGGLIDFIAPTDASYLLQVHDFLFRGGDAYFYRLTLSTGPHVDFILPPCGLPGSKTNYTVYGRNLPGGKPVKGQTLDGKPLEQLSVEISFPSDQRVRRLNTGLLIRPSEAAIDGFEYRLKTPKGVSNPFLLGFASAPVVLEQEPNNQPAQGQKLVPPCEVAGQFYPAGEQDWYTFQAKKGDTYWIEVLSQRLGLPTDPSLVLQRVSKGDNGEEKAADVLELADNDTNLGEREFNTISRDPAGRFEAKEDGTYRLLIRDLFTRTERSPRFLYRLAIRKEAPDFRLVAMAVVPKAKSDAKNIEMGVPLLRRGETIALRVMAFRQGFTGDIDLSLEQPPPGLLFQGDRIPSGQNTDYILLTAAEDAPAYAGPIRLVGKAKVGDQEVVSEARGATLVFAVGNTDNERPQARLARELTLAITDKESAPVTVAPAEQKTWEAPANAKLKIPLTIKRRGDFNGSFKLKPLGPGTQDALKEFEVESQATNATLTLDLAALKLAAGSYVFSAQSQVTGKYRNNPEAAAFAEASAKESEKVAGELDAAAKKATADFDATVKPATEAEAAAKSAHEKADAAKKDLANAPTDEKLTAARDAAVKAAEEADAKAKTAAEAKAAAEKAKTTAQALAKEAQTKKEGAAARAKEASERAKPKDATVAIHCVPIHVKVTPVEQAKTK
jgi:hypothetical protein